MTALRRLAAVVVVVFSSALFWAPSAHAVSISFADCISGNDVTDCNIGLAQLSVDVTDPGGSQVLFTFLNSGPADSSITDLYFDDGSLLSLNSIMNGPGTAFSTPAVPSELPSAGSASPPFVTTLGFSADSDPPPSVMGVNPGENVGILFDLMGGQTYADVLTELDDATLRIGLHVQAFDGGGSESIVTPEPSTGVLLTLGLLLTALRTRRRS